MRRTQKITGTSAESHFTMAGDKHGRIIIGLMSDLSLAALTALSAHLNKEFRVPVDIVALDHDVSFALNRRRNQYSSPKILAKLRRIDKGPRDKVLGIVDVDLYCPEYDYVFGEADASSGVATLSINRLRQDTSGANLIQSRIIKEATHEIGHLFDLGHCDDPNCVMSFSTGNLSQIDSKTSFVCPKCHAPTMAPKPKTLRN